MTKTKAKVLKIIRNIILSLLAIAIVIVAVLFFPLKGKEHIEIWSTSDKFDISKIETVEKNCDDFKILMLTDTQLWANLGKNKECYDEMDKLVDKHKELGSTKYIFCGHDHENNASVTDDGITYTYGLKTGPSPIPWNFAKETGGTLITITGQGQTQNVSIDNYVINEHNR